eukprot:TRINITY_DN19005_c0_g1_i1.p1 TRINITY_DN19005_c0_g1~~TRINITY_DN19005_c0_g1_i1.p1  ORF type:complete len:580 (+),score=160.67 TRINITY_DN19005_c0_g1_i1:103-1740(+)
MAQGQGPAQRYSADYSRWDAVGADAEEEERAAALAERSGHLDRHLEAQRLSGMPPPVPAGEGAPPIAAWQGGNLADWLVRAQAQGMGKRPPDGEPETSPPRQRSRRYQVDYSRFQDIGSDDELEVTVSHGQQGPAAAAAAPIEGPIGPPSSAFADATGSGMVARRPGMEVDADAPLTDEEFDILQAHTRERLGLPQPPPLPPECMDDPAPAPAAPGGQPQRRTIGPAPTAPAAPGAAATGSGPTPPAAGAAEESCPPAPTCTSPAHRPSLLPRAGQRAKHSMQPLQLSADGTCEGERPAPSPRPAAPAAAGGEGMAVDGASAPSPAAAAAAPAAGADPAQEAPAVHAAADASPAPAGEAAAPGAAEEAAEGAEPGTDKLTMNGGRVGDRYLWSQTADTAVVRFIVPKGTKGKQVHPFLSEKVLGIAVAPLPGGVAPSAVRGDLCGRLAYRVQEPEDGWSTPEWEIHDWEGDPEGRRLVSISLKKHATPGAWAWWPRAFHGDPTIVLDGILKRTAESAAKLHDFLLEERKRQRDGKKGQFSQWIDI